MGLKSVKDYAVKAIAMISMAAVVAGIGVSYVNPVDVTADGAKYTTFYDVFKDRSGKPSKFMTQEAMQQKVLANCKKLSGIGYSSGNQENYLACDGFVSLVFRLTFGTAHEFTKRKDKYYCKFNIKEEHKVACSYVDRYEVYRPGGTSVTWLYKNYVNKVVKPRGSKRKKVEGMNNAQWVEYLNKIGAQPGDIIFWDNDKDDKFWTHIGIYAGIEKGVAKMWHASAVKKKVMKQNLSEITNEVCYLDYACVVALTDVPARIGLFADLENSSSDFSFSVYKDAVCKTKIGRLASSCTLKDETALDSIKVWPSDDKDVYERTLYLRRDMAPYKVKNAELAGSDQTVFKLVIRIEAGPDKKGKLTYAIYGAKDMRYYGGKTINYYDYLTGSKVIPITDLK